MIALKYILVSALVLGVATAATTLLKSADARDGGVKNYMGFGSPGLGYGQEYGQGYGGYGGFPGLNQGPVPPYYRGSYGEWPYGNQGGGFYQQYPQYPQYQGYQPGYPQPGYPQPGYPYYNNYASSAETPNKPGSTA